MLDHDGGEEPVAYAILSDVQPHQVRYLRSHEGPGAITCDTAEGTDWSGFEAILRTMHDATNPLAQLGQAIAGRTILWVDPESDDTVDGASMAPTWSCSTGRWARQCSRQCEPRTSEHLPSCSPAQRRQRECAERHWHWARLRRSPTGPTCFARSNECSGLPDVRGHRDELPAECARELHRHRRVCRGPALGCRWPR
jgi:hypothetical protein